MAIPGIATGALRARWRPAGPGAGQAVPGVAPRLLLPLSTAAEAEFLQSSRAHPLIRPGSTQAKTSIRSKACCATPARPFTSGRRSSSLIGYFSQAVENATRWIARRSTTPRSATTERRWSPGSLLRRGPGPWRSWRAPRSQSRPTCRPRPSGVQARLARLQEQGLGLVVALLSHEGPGHGDLRLGHCGTTDLPAQADVEGLASEFSVRAAVLDRHVVITSSRGSWPRRMIGTQLAAKSRDRFRVRLSVAARSPADVATVAVSRSVRVTAVCSLPSTGAGPERRRGRQVSCTASDEIHPPHVLHHDRDLGVLVARRAFRDREAPL